ncbi:hypothetical protein EFL02_10205, partial [Enterococcus faecium]|nr:hypothetical protein [Enterococcus faecium]
KLTSIKKKLGLANLGCSTYLKSLDQTKTLKKTFSIRRIEYREQRNRETKITIELEIGRK